MGVLRKDLDLLTELIEGGLMLDHFQNLKITEEGRIEGP